jgi:hypothetical protein
MPVTNDDIMKELKKMRKSSIASSILIFGFSLMAVGASLYYAMPENEKIYGGVLLILGLVAEIIGFILLIITK